jgi:phospholipid transport system substrate-binding protein
VINKETFAMAFSLPRRASRGRSLAKGPLVARLIGICLGLAALAAAPAVLAADPAAARTEAFINAFKKVKSGDTLSPADKKANEKAFAELDKFMDFETLTSKPLEPRAAKFTAKQKAQFATEFRDLVRRIAYPNSGDFFRDAKLKIGAPAEKAGATAVPIDAHLPKEDLRTTIELFWTNKGGALKLTDVAFDGDSLVKDYQNQFARIVDKEGAAGVMKKLEDKRAELAKGGGGTK